MELEFCSFSHFIHRMSQRMLGCSNSPAVRVYQSRHHPPFPSAQSCRKLSRWTELNLFIPMSAQMLHIPPSQCIGQRRSFGRNLMFGAYLATQACSTSVAKRQRKTPFRVSITLRFRKKSARYLLCLDLNGNRSASCILWVAVILWISMFVSLKSEKC